MNGLANKQLVDKVVKGQKTSFDKRRQTNNSSVKPEDADINNGKTV